MSPSGAPVLAPTSSKRVLCRLGAQTHSQQTFEIFVTSPRYKFGRLRRISFKFGNFIDFKTLFPTLPADFLYLVHISIRETVKGLFYDS